MAPGREEPGWRRGRRAGSALTMYSLLSFIQIPFVLSFVLPFSGGPGRKETGRPHHGGIVVRGLLRVTPGGDGKGEKIR